MAHSMSEAIASPFMAPIDSAMNWFTANNRKIWISTIKSKMAVWVQFAAIRRILKQLLELGTSRNSLQAGWSFHLLIGITVQRGIPIRLRALGLSTVVPANVAYAIKSLSKSSGMKLLHLAEKKSLHGVSINLKRTANAVMSWLVKTCEWLSRAVGSIAAAAFATKSGMTSFMGVQQRSMQ